MPGEQVDLGGYSRKEQEGCIPLQEALRKGEFICIGLGIGHREKRLEDAKRRILRSQAQQPLVPVFSEESEPDFDPASVSRAETIQPVIERFHYHETRPNPVETVDKFEGMITMDESGIMAIHNFPAPFQRAKPDPTKPVLPEQPTITPERIREIMSQRCISFRTNGKKCKRWAVLGYEHCVDHMPKKTRQEYKAKKKQGFFKQ